MFIACSLKDSRNFFIQFLPLHTLCLFTMFLNDDIDIEKRDGICSPTFVVNEFSGLCLHLSIFTMFQNCYFHILFYEIHLFSDAKNEGN